MADAIRRHGSRRDVAGVGFDGWEDAEDRFVEIGEGKDELVFDFGFEGEVFDSDKGAEQF